MKPNSARAGVLFPSPRVGEGGEIERSENEPGEGFVSADRDPSSGTDCVRATFSHRGRREEPSFPVDDVRKSISHV
jgi:hypothetical protein